LDYGVTLGDASCMRTVLEKLTSGRPEGVRPGTDTTNDVRVLTIGGSFTHGEGCKDESGHEGTPCSWVSRLQRWFQKSYPNTDFTWYDKAKPSTTSGVFLTGIGALVRSLPSAPDLVLIDTLVNDASEPKRGLETLQSVGSEEAQSAAYEALLRAFREILPNAQLLIVEDACPACISAGDVHTKVAEHYNIPIVNFARMAKEYNRAGNASADRLWPQTEAQMQGPYGKVGSVWPNFEPEMLVKLQTCCTTNHPPWVVHQYISDSVGHAINKLLDAACGMDAASLLSQTQQEIEPFWPQEVLDKFPSCSRPLSYYTASDAANVSPTIASGDWQLIEDKKGKPGWIATARGATIIFPVQLDKIGALTVSYLTSYEGVGKAEAKLRPASAPGKTGGSATLNGRVVEHFSQVRSEFFGLNSMNPGGLLDCPKDPDHMYELLITLPPDMPASTKFKIVEVTSC